MKAKIKTLFSVIFGGALFASGLYIIAIRLFFDFAEFRHGGHIGPPGSAAIGILFLPFIPPITIGLVAVIALMARRMAHRNNVSRSVWVAATVFASLLAFALLYIWPLRYLCPGLVLGRVLHSSAGYYVGAIGQCALGGVLLIDLFCRRNPENKGSQQSVPGYPPQGVGSPEP